MSHRFVVAVAAALVCIGCTGDEAADVEPSCDQPEVLVEQDLTRDIPSEPFTVRADRRFFASVVSDVDYSPEALFSMVGNLYVIEDGAEPAFREDPINGIRAAADPVVQYDRQGQWRELELEPGRWQVWSTRGPKILIVACPL